LPPLPAARRECANQDEEGEGGHLLFRMPEVEEDSNTVVENKKPNRSKLLGFLVFAGKSIPSQQAVGISTQQTIKANLF